jgi:hypothetical protein
MLSVEPLTGKNPAPWNFLFLPAGNNRWECTVYHCRSVKFLVALMAHLALPSSANIRIMQPDRCDKNNKHLGQRSNL